ncbi:MAG: succinate dehydrogenase/fumarate reductase iron-sulfur subunit [Bradymonadales bacterium]|nr:MAG: succinate dehydrogenase/fumarate reductase iron-sulfur subunit [Bradymonadales bacterium]
MTADNKKMKISLKIWRQESPQAAGHFEAYELDDVTPEMSFLEMLDHLNEKLVSEGKTPVYFESDCREGICGTCGLVINGIAHGVGPRKATCQLHMRSFQDGETIHVEPWRAKAFPVIQDLGVDRSAFDRIIAAGGYVSVNTGNAPDGNSLPVGKTTAEQAFDAAACIGCGACVAACKNASASLFVSAKISQYALLPQGQPERARRAGAMVAQMEEEAFGSCTNETECSAVCPKGISFENIVRMNREFLRSQFGSTEIE